ncbi:MAG: hypothetical protein AB8G17_16685 [Gammaproteobacteria bacterium]
MIDALISPPMIAVVVAGMIVETVFLVRVFRRRQDGDRVGMTLGNAVAGACLMAAIVSEMTNQAAAITGVCLIGALAGHVIEVWLRLR